MLPASLRKRLLVLISAAWLAGCAAQGVTLPESQFLRLLESKKGTIAYLGMDGNMYTINQGGADKVQITDDIGDLSPEFVFSTRRFAWSPTGDRLAYIGFANEDWSVMVSAPDGSEPTRLYGSDTESPIFLQWSPGGDRLLYTVQIDPFLTGGVTSLGLYALPADGAGDGALLAEGYPLFYSWEPEGDRALVHTGGYGEENPEARVSMLTSGSDFEDDLSLTPAGFLTPAWSPDGTRLLMGIEDVQGRNALVVTNLQGNVRRTITTFEKSIAFTWSPDSRWIGYIASDREREGASGHLVIVDAENGEELFRTEEHLVNAFIWSPDSKQLVYFTQELASDGNPDNLYFALGLHFLDTESWEARHPRLGDLPFVFQPTPHFRQYLLTFEQFQQGATIWSPDGEYVVLAARTEDQGVILLVTVSGNREPRELDTGLIAFWSAGE